MTNIAGGNPIPALYPNQPNLDDTYEIIRSKLPLFKEDIKGEYLTLRACNFSQTEACAMLGIEYKTLQAWRSRDTLFFQWETDHVGQLQSRVADSILQGMFFRCMFLTMKADSQTLEKQVNSPSSMTADEKDWAKDAAKRYKIADYTTFLKALNGDVSDEPRSRGGVNIQVNVNGAEVEEYNSRAAGNRKVLEQFTRNRNLVIEGELEESSDE